VYFSLGKPVAAAVATLSLAACISRRLFVNDVRTGKRFLVNSGVKNFVMLPIAGASRKSDIALIAANGTRIVTYGPKSLQLDIGLTRQFAWTFEIADVARPIL